MKNRTFFFFFTSMVIILRSMTDYTSSENVRFVRVCLFVCVGKWV